MEHGFAELPWKLCECLGRNAAPGAAAGLGGFLSGQDDQIANPVDPGIVQEQEHPVFAVCRAPSEADGVV
jgi:hypothetical protein